MSYKLKQLEKQYHSCFLLLTKSFVNDEITLDEFKSSLSTLCENYRKDKQNVEKKTLI